MSRLLTLGVKWLTVHFLKRTCAIKNKGHPSRNVQETAYNGIVLFILGNYVNANTGKESHPLNLQAYFFTFLKILAHLISFLPLRKQKALHFLMLQKF